MGVKVAIGALPLTPRNMHIQRQGQLLSVNGQGLHIIESRLARDGTAHVLLLG